jgi:8-oxo-dGTP pyrophosphatase MutT (NUDIX family)
MAVDLAMQPGQHRETARILLTNPSGQILLLLTHFDPEVGLPPRWITPGGGIDSGETTIEAAVRELHEETGLLVSQEALGEMIGQIAGRWDWADGKNHHTYVDYFYKLVVDDFALDDSGWTEDERRDVVDFRWWGIDELIATAEPVAPHGLANLVRNHF